MPIIFTAPEASTAWDITAATYDGVAYTVAEQNNVFDVFFKPDGTKMYVLGNTPTFIHQYTLSTPWLVSTATYDSVSFPTGTQYYGMFIKPDGLTMFITDAAVDGVRRFALSTAWDISSASGSGFLDVQFQDTAPTDVFIKSDGTKAYVLGVSNERIYQYSMPTPWSFAGATYDGLNRAFPAGENSFGGLFFRDDGTSFYTLINSVAPTHVVRQYDPTTPWVVSPSSIVGSFDTTGQTTLGRGLFFRDDGKKMYIGHPAASDQILQYSL